MAAKQREAAGGADPAKAPKDPLTMASFKERARTWFARHNGVACVCIAILTFFAVAGLFAFVAFSDFGGSADFIYNQF